MHLKANIEKKKLSLVSYWLKLFIQSTAAQVVWHFLHLCKEVLYNRTPRNPALAVLSRTTAFPYVQWCFDISLKLWKVTVKTYHGRKAARIFASFLQKSKLNWYRMGSQIINGIPKQIIVTLCMYLDNGEEACEEIYRMIQNHAA